jgi:predicted RNA-binding Zn ribbon-like protein
MPVMPGRSVDDLLAVANARHGPAGHWHSRAGADAADHDHLRRPAEAVRFLADHDVAIPETRPPRAALAALGILARDVRALAGGTAGGWPTPAVAALLDGATYRLTADGRLASVAREPWTRLVDELAAAAVGLGRAGEALRVCDNPLCRFVFLDRSRNRSRRWCDMAACGNRAKLRRFRATGAAGRVDARPLSRRGG